MTRRQRAWLIVAPLTLATGDIVLTLAGQPPAYWKGSYAAVQEANPLARMLLVHNPATFGVAAFAWLGVCVFAIGKLPTASAVLLAFALSLGHAIGGATWMWRLEPVGIGAALLYLIAAERLVHWTWLKTGVRLQDRAD